MTQKWLEGGVWASSPRAEALRAQAAAGSPLTPAYKPDIYHFPSVREKKSLIRCKRLRTQAWVLRKMVERGKLLYRHLGQIPPGLAPYLMDHGAVTLEPLAFRERVARTVVDFDDGLFCGQKVSGEPVVARKGRKVVAGVTRVPRGYALSSAVRKSAEPGSGNTQVVRLAPKNQAIVVATGGRGRGGRRRSGQKPKPKEADSSIPVVDSIAKGVSMVVNPPPKALAPRDPRRRSKNVGVLVDGTLGTAADLMRAIPVVGHVAGPVADVAAQTVRVAEDAVNAVAHPTGMVIFIIALALLPTALCAPTNGSVSTASEGPPLGWQNVGGLPVLGGVLIFIAGALAFAGERAAVPSATFSLVGVFLLLLSLTPLAGAAHYPHLCVNGNETVYTNACPPWAVKACLSNLCLTEPWCVPCINKKCWVPRAQGLSTPRAGDNSWLLDAISLDHVLLIPYVCDAMELGEVCGVVMGILDLAATTYDVGLAHSCACDCVMTDNEMSLMAELGWVADAAADAYTHHLWSVVKFLWQLMRKILGMLDFSHPVILVLAGVYTIRTEWGRLILLLLLLGLTESVGATRVHYLWWHHGNYELTARENTTNWTISKVHDMPRGIHSWELDFALTRTGRRQHEDYDIKELVAKGNCSFGVPVLNDGDYFLSGTPRGESNSTTTWCPARANITKPRELACWDANLLLHMSIFNATELKMRRMILTSGWCYLFDLSRMAITDFCLIDRRDKARCGSCKCDCGPIADYDHCGMTPRLTPLLTATTIPGKVATMLSRWAYNTSIAGESVTMYDGRPTWVQWTTPMKKPKKGRWPMPGAPAFISGAIRVAPWHAYPTGALGTGGFIRLSADGTRQLLKVSHMLPPIPIFQHMVFVIVLMALGGGRLAPVAYFFMSRWWNVDGALAPTLGAACVITRIPTSGLSGLLKAAAIGLHLLSPAPWLSTVILKIAAGYWRWAAAGLLLSYLLPDNSVTGQEICVCANLTQVVNVLTERETAVAWLGVATSVIIVLTSPGLDSLKRTMGVKTRAFQVWTSLRVSASPIGKHFTNPHARDVAVLAVAFFDQELYLTFVVGCFVLALVLDMSAMAIEKGLTSRKFPDTLDAMLGWMRRLGYTDATMGRVHRLNWETEATHLACDWINSRERFRPARKTVVRKWKNGRWERCSDDRMLVVMLLVLATALAIWCPVVFIPIGLMLIALRLLATLRTEVQVKPKKSKWEKGYNSYIKKTDRKKGMRLVKYRRPVIHPVWELCSEAGPEIPGSIAAESSVVQKWTGFATCLTGRQEYNASGASIFGVGTPCSNFMATAVNGHLYTVLHGSRGRTIATAQGPSPPLVVIPESDVAIYRAPPGARSLVACECGVHDGFLVGKGGAMMKVTRSLDDPSLFILRNTVPMSALRGTSGSAVICPQGHVMGMMRAGRHHCQVADSVRVTPLNGELKVNSPGVAVTEDSEAPALPTHQEVADKGCVIKTYNAPTGAGKTTKLPLAIMRQKEGTKVLVLNPSVATTKGVVTYMQRAYGVTPSLYVGGQVRIVGTNLAYATYGKYLTKREELLQWADVVICDEVHSMDGTTILGIATVLQDCNINNVKMVVLATATPPGMPVKPHPNITEEALSDGDIPFAGARMDSRKYMAGRHLVFCTTKRTCEEVANALKGKGIHAVTYWRGTPIDVIPEEGDVVVCATDALMTGYTGNFDSVTDSCSEISEMGSINFDPTISFNLRTDLSSAVCRAQRRGRTGRGKPGIYRPAQKQCRQHTFIGLATISEIYESGMAWYDMAPRAICTYMEKYSSCTGLPCFAHRPIELLKFFEEFQYVLNTPALKTAMESGYSHPVLTAAQVMHSIDYDKGARPDLTDRWEAFKMGKPAAKPHLLLKLDYDGPSADWTMDDTVKKLRYALGYACEDTDLVTAGLFAGVCITAAMIVVDATCSFYVKSEVRLLSNDGCVVAGKVNLLNEGPSFEECANVGIDFHHAAEVAAPFFASIATHVKSVVGWVSQAATAIGLQTAEVAPGWMELLSQSLEGNWNSWVAAVMVGGVAVSANKNPLVASICAGIATSYGPGGAVLKALISVLGAAALSSVASPNAVTTIAAGAAAGLVLSGSTLLSVMQSMLSGYAASTGVALLTYQIFTGHFPSMNEVFDACGAIFNPGAAVAGVVAGASLAYAVRGGETTWMNRLLAITVHGSVLPPNFFVEASKLEEEIRSKLRAVGMRGILTKLYSWATHTDEVLCESEFWSPLIGLAISLVRYLVEKCQKIGAALIPKVPFYSCTPPYRGPWKGAGTVEAWCGCGASAVVTIKNGKVEKTAYSSKMCTAGLTGGVPLHKFNMRGPYLNVTALGTNGTHDSPLGLQDMVRLESQEGKITLINSTTSEMTTAGLKRACRAQSYALNGGNTGVGTCSPKYLPKGMWVTVDGKEVKLPWEIPPDICGTAQEHVVVEMGPDPDANTVFLIKTEKQVEEYWKRQEEKKPGIYIWEVDKNNADDDSWSDVDEPFEFSSEPPGLFPPFGLATEAVTEAEPTGPAEAVGQGPPVTEPTTQHQEPPQEIGTTAPTSSGNSNKGEPTLLLLIHSDHPEHEAVTLSYIVGWQEIWQKGWWEYKTRYGRVITCPDSHWLSCVAVLEEARENIHMIIIQKSFDAVIDQLEPLGKKYLTVVCESHHWDCESQCVKTDDKVSSFPIVCQGPAHEWSDNLNRLLVLGMSEAKKYPQVSNIDDCRKKLDYRIPVVPDMPDLTHEELYNQIGSRSIVNTDHGGEETSVTKTSTDDPADGGAPQENPQTSNENPIERGAKEVPVADVGQQQEAGEVAPQDQQGSDTVISMEIVNSKATPQIDEDDQEASEDSGGWEAEVEELEDVKWESPKEWKTSVILEEGSVSDFYGCTVVWVDKKQVPYTRAGKEINNRWDHHARNQHLHIIHENKGGVGLIGMVNHEDDNYFLARVETQDAGVGAVAQTIGVVLSQIGMCLNSDSILHIEYPGDKHCTVSTFINAVARYACIEGFGGTISVVTKRHLDAMVVALNGLTNLKPGSTEETTSYSYLWTPMANLAPVYRKPEMTVIPRFTTGILKYRNVVYKTDPRRYRDRMVNVTVWRNQRPPDIYLTKERQRVLELAKGYTYGYMTPKEIGEATRAKAARSCVTGLTGDDVKKWNMKARACFKRALDEIRNEKTSRFTECTVMCKEEVFVTGPEKDYSQKAPRFICYPPLDTRTVEKYILGHSIKVVGNIMGEAYGFRYTPWERAQHIVKMWKGKKSPMGFGVDTVCYDSRITPEDVEFETEVYAATASSHDHELDIRTLSRKLYAGGPLINSLGVEVGHRACRASGVLTTSSSNTLTCYVKLRAALHAVGWKAAEVLICGDDAIVITESSGDPIKDQATAASLRKKLDAYGLEQAEDIVPQYELDAISSCSSNVTSAKTSKDQIHYFPTRSCRVPMGRASYEAKNRNNMGNWLGWAFMNWGTLWAKWIFGHFLEVLMNSEAETGAVEVELMGMHIVCPLEKIPLVILALNGPESFNLKQYTTSEIDRLQKDLEVLGAPMIKVHKKKLRQIRVAALRHSRITAYLAEKCLTSAVGGDPIWTRAEVDEAKMIKERYKQTPLWEGRTLRLNFTPREVVQRWWRDNGVKTLIVTLAFLAAAATLGTFKPG